MRQMDEWVLDDPTIGVISMVDLFRDQRVRVNLKRVRQLILLMGLMYLTTIIDIFSRKIVSWGLSNSLSNDCCLEVVHKAIEKQRYVYLNPANDGLEWYQGIERFITNYKRKTSRYWKDSS